MWVEKTFCHFTFAIGLKQTFIGIPASRPLVAVKLFSARPDAVSSINSNLNGYATVCLRFICLIPSTNKMWNKLFSVSSSTRKEMFVLVVYYI